MGAKPATNTRELQRLIERLIPVVDDSFRVLYDSEERTRPHPPAPSALIAAFEQKHRLKFPPSYRVFLRLHNGWERYADGYSFVGVTGRHTARALADIKKTVTIFLDSWVQTYGEPNADSIRQYQSRGNLANRLEVDGQPFLPIMVHFGTNFNGGLRFFDPDKPQPEGELEVVSWSSRGGTLTRYRRFVDMLRQDLHRLTKEVKTHPR